jgi:two-component system, LytTR family, response regulator
MNRMRVVIVDDEPLARRGIRQLLSGATDVEIAGEARNGKEAVRLLKLLSPDLVFLDVQMPECDGFDVLRQLHPHRLPLLVFVTAYDTFAIRAFDAHAVDYLVKPIHEARFQRALDRARERLRSREAIEISRREAAPSGHDAGKGSQRDQAPRRLILGAAGSDFLVDLTEIEWIEADDYYAAVHTRGGRHLVRESLASLEERLDRTQFVRVHRSAIVNLARVRQVRYTGIGDAVVVLDSGVQLPLGRRRRERVAAAIRRFAG